MDINIIDLIYKLNESRKNLTVLNEFFSLKVNNFCSYFVFQGFQIWFWIFWRLILCLWDKGVDWNQRTVVTWAKSFATLKAQSCSLPDRAIAFYWTWTGLLYRRLTINTGIRHLIFPDLLRHNLFRSKFFWVLWCICHNLCSCFIPPGIYVRFVVAKRFIAVLTGFVTGYAIYPEAGLQAVALLGSSADGLNFWIIWKEIKIVLSVVLLTCSCWFCHAGHYSGVGD